ncbi:MAG: hypothetical protein HKN15_02495 [Xanthomonadales bacterium]|nr:hypothetical protein [Xanthomonadales bacterium]
MNNSINTRRQKGYNILEVLMGIAIFAIGMLALASLQGSLTRSAADANVRTVAINLAESLIETRRGFARLTDATGTFAAYDDIASETINITRGGIPFTVASTVTDYYYNVASDTFTTTAPAGVTISDFKLMSVRVSWDGVAQRTIEGAVEDIGTFSALSNICGTGKACIVINETISSVTTAAASKAVTQTTNGLDPFAITYTPGLRPDIVSLNLGNNKFKESLTPEPDVIRRDELVDTRFDVITYSQTGDGNFFVRREEFAAVSCECTLKAPTGTPEDSGIRPTIWAGDEYVEGHFVNKPFGESANNQQSQLCDSCCRDHHDGGSSAEDHSDTAVNKYNPWRASGDYFSSGTFDGDHKHYNITNQGNLVLANTANSTYVEACRLVRKDGFFKVAQDFRQEDLHTFPEDFLDDESEVTTYSNYVTTAANAFENATHFNYEDDIPAICIGGPTPCVAQPTYGGSYDTALGAGEFPVWTQLPLDGESEQQLRSRGVYIDYLSSDFRTVVDCLRAGGDADSCQTGDVILDLNTSTNILEIMPFFDVQLTFLNRWTETPNNTPVDTTNEGLEDDNAHSRGVASKDALGGSTVEASGHKGNLGFTDTEPVDLTYASFVRTDTIEVQALDSGGGGGGTPPPSTHPVVSGNFSETINGVRVTDIEIDGQNGALCDRTTTGFECEVPVGATNPRIRIFGYGKANADHYACLTGNTLAQNSEVTNGVNAQVIYELHNTIPPNPVGGGYNVNFQTTPCS